MNLLSKLTIKNLKLNKKRTIVTIIGIILSVALITAVASIYTSGIASLINYETSVKGNFHVGFIDVPIDDIETIKNNSEVEDVYITQEVGYSVLEDSKNEYKPYAYVMAFTEESLENLAINLIEGRLPENDTEIVIPSHLKTNGRIELNVGDTITLDVGTRLRNGEELNQNNPYEEDMDEEIVDTETKTYTIVGKIQRPSTNVEFYSAPGYTFITYLDANNLSEKNVNVYAKYTKSGIKNYLSVTANILDVDEEIFSKYMTDDYTNYEEQEEVFEKYYEEVSKAKYGYQLNSYLIELERSPLNNTQTGSLMAVAIIVCVIIVGTSVFCIKNSFDISITEKTKQYGMLKSIGATKRQIRKNVFFEGAILGLIGIPLGILSGFFASYILIIISNYFLEDSLTAGFTLEFAFSWVSVLIAVLVGIVTIYLSSISGSRHAAKTSPIESIRNSGNIKIKSNKLKTPKVIKKIFGIGGEISYKNLKRNKKKYRTTVISITVSVLVFISLYSFMDMAFETIEYEYSTSDWNLYLAVEGNACYNIALESTKFDNIEEYTVYRSLYSNIKNPKYNDEYKEIMDNYGADEDDYEGYVIVSAVGEDQYKKYVDELGLNYDEIKDKAILIDYRTIQKYDEEKNITKDNHVREYSYSKGDKIEVNIDEESIQLEIGEATTSKPFGITSSSSLLIISDELFNSINAEEEQVVFFYDSTNPDKLQDDIEELLIDYEDEYYISNKSENVRIMKNLYILIGIFLYGFIIVISLIGITTIFNTITTNMQLRRREFASLKSIGMTKKEFNRMISLESIFMGIKSLIFGVPIGIGISYLIYHFLMVETGLPYNLPIVAISIAIIAVFILISCIMRYSMNKINKQNIIETIRNENI